MNENHQTDQTRSLYFGLGLTHNPFLPGGPWMSIASQQTTMRELKRWWQGESPIASVTGDHGTGKTRLVTEFSHDVVRNNMGRVVFVRDLTTRVTDVILLQRMIRACGGQPVGRSGIELRSELIATLGSRPTLMVIDDAPVSGSQLEVLQSLFDVAPIRIVLIGDQALAGRLSRRPTLQHTSIAMRPLSRTDTFTFIRRRIRAANARTSGSIDLSDDLLNRVFEQANGNIGATVAIMHELLVEALARPTREIDSDLVRLVCSGGSDSEDRVIQVSHVRSDQPEAASAPREER